MQEAPGTTLGASWIELRKHLVQSPKLPSQALSRSAAQTSWVPLPPLARSKPRLPFNLSAPYHRAPGHLRDHHGWCRGRLWYR